MKQRLISMSNVMNTITAREPVPRQSALVRVIFNERDPLDIPIACWVEYGLKVGLAIDNDLMQTLQCVAAHAQVKSLLSRYLSMKPRTEQEVDAYLRKRDIPQELRNAVIADLKSSGAINDELYSTLYIESKAKRHSHKEIVWRLKEKGVKSAIVQSLLQSEEAVQEERNTARSLAKKHWMKHEKLPLRERRLKVASFLQRKGFPMHVIRTVIDELQNGASDELS